VNTLRVIATALLAAALDVALVAWALGGFGPLLQHPIAPALLLVWAAAGVILALLRPVRAQDVVTRAPESPAVLIALFLVPLAATPLAAWGQRLGIAVLPGSNALGWLGIAISGIGLAIRIAAMAQLGPRFSPLLAVQRAHDLETSGLYAHVRHPGYAGAWLASLGGTLAFGGGLGLPLVAAMGLLLWNRAGREEALLERRFGDAWRAYRARTGRFVPLPGGRRSGNPRPASGS
jgi:protein-S-isoprenylcysteine O-methyltransferase Ste14